MHDLKPLTALGGVEPRTDKIGSVTCVEVPDVALASVAARLGQEKATLAELKKTLGVAAPGPGGFAEKALGAFWTGPDQWMVEAPYDTHEDLANLLKSKLKDAASVTEQSGAWVRFDLSGNGVCDVLERLCKLDIRAMTASDAGRSTVEHLGCFVICRDENAFSVLGPRSSAGTLHHALTTAMTSVA